MEHLRVIALHIAPKYPENSAVLTDLTATYKWLEEHVAGTDLGPCISKYRNERLFLNVDAPNAGPHIWHCADQLFFDIDDYREQFGVRKFLIPFSGLLELAGVVKVVSPKRPALIPSSAEVQLMQLRNGLCGMRHEHSLTDVRLASEDGNTIDAHRLVLATASDYLSDMFCGGFSEARGDASHNDPVVVHVKDCAHNCLLSIVGECYTYIDEDGRSASLKEFVYTGVSPCNGDPNELIQILRLCRYWRINELCDIVDAQLTGHISLHTYNGCEFVNYKSK